MSEKVSFVYGMMVEERNKYYVMLSSIIKTAFSIFDLKDAQKTFRSEKKKYCFNFSKKIGYYLLFVIWILKKQSYFVVQFSSNSLKMSILFDMKSEKVCGVA